MKPKIIIKSLQVTFDLLQGDLEEAKTMADQATFQRMLEAIKSIQKAQDLVRESIPPLVIPIIAEETNEIK